MKKILSILLLAGLLLSVVACSDDGEVKQTTAGTTAEPEPSDDTPMIAEGYQIDLSKYLTLPEFSAIRLTNAQLEEKWLEEAKLIQENNAEHKDTAEGYVSVNGDLLNIHYKGYAAKEEDEISEDTLKNMTNISYDADGQLDEGYDLVLGSNSFVGKYESEEHPENNNPGFEEQLIGMKAGETRTITVTFPDDYQNSQELQGKVIKFDVTVNSIQNVILPELTDEMVSEYTAEQYKTVADFKAYIVNYYTAVLAYEEILKQAKPTTFPDDLIDDAISEYVYDYVEYMYPDEDLTNEELKAVFDEQYETAKKSAEESVGTRMVLEALFKKLDITLNYGEYKALRASEFEEYYYYYYYYYGLTTVEDMEDYFGRDQLITQFKYNMLLERLPKLITVSE